MHMLCTNVAFKINMDTGPVELFPLLFVKICAIPLISKNDAFIDPDSVEFFSNKWYWLYEGPRVMCYFILSPSYIDDLVSGFVFFYL